CVPLDPVDFQERSITTNATWPISHAEFAAHLKTACRYANCGEAFQLPVQGLEAAANQFTTANLMRYADPVSFGRAYRDVVAGSSLIAACLGATVTALTFGNDDRISAVEIVGRDGTRGLLRARVFVLACGGVETTRLLLAAQAEAPARFGGEDGPLGRYYMGHLSGDIADIHLAHAGLDKAFDFFRTPDGAFGRRRITASAEFQTKENLTNISFWPKLPAMADPSHRDPVLSLAYLALSFPPLGRALVSESLRRINVGDGDRKLLHLRNVACGIPSIARFLPRFIHGRTLASRRLPGLHLRNGARRYALHYHAEHLPDADSRIRLTNGRDPLGLRKVMLDLRFKLQDAREVIRTHEHLDSWLKSTGLGQLVWHDVPQEREARVLDQAGDGVHQIGTARMAARAKDGVVDRDCRVFGCSNLFLAGSAVFPTSGQANPTLSAIALASRLAQRIAGEVSLHEAG
ncbi:MAG: GMC family oxidoreductase, partial [Alphaproteobacteria bacterium]